MTLPDQQARERALDTQRSFIVQAPAGSGKTELLVQRFLALLAQVERAPEEIIAITFTRKAAAEMRQRILDALRAASHPQPTEPHAQKTWQLAFAAWNRNQQSQWHLLENPNRLRVQTIDSLCATIVRQAPLLSGLGTAQDILTTDAKQYYQAATQRLLANLEEHSPFADAIARLLLHLDNRVYVVENLLIRMLQRRDQWLGHIIAHGKSLTAIEFRQVLEQSLQHVVQEAIQRCEQAMPTLLRDELWQLLQFAQDNLSSKKTISQLEPDTVWRLAANLLLTQQHSWRTRIDKNTGFPPAQKSMKQRMLALLAQLNPYDDLRQSLAALLDAPPPAYTDAQWQIIQALVELLPLLVAELKVLFRENGVADFSEVAMAANTALGDKDSPTDLTLLLEDKIRHILVDEFQDTAMTQFRLLEKLTAEWQPNDGRTLFLVGDPMQSIYRFREAEVGLFLKTQQEGLGNLILEPLTLQANFRSTPAIVNWINQHFPPIFPLHTDISAGAVPFSPGIATQENQDSGVFLHPYNAKTPNTSADAEKIIQIISDEQSRNPTHHIAILVRSRAHLSDIIPALTAAKLAFNAVEIDALGAQNVVQDLLALTGALLHLGNRLCWLAILRAPWCGLTLQDLHSLAKDHHHQPLWQTLSHDQTLADLSADGRMRLAHIVPVLHHSLQQRGRLSLRSWVEKTWRALNGHLCVSDHNELTSADAYFTLLDSYAQNQPWPEFAELQNQVANQYVAPPTNANSRLHIMTIHKAKGLEFDSVIIPHLHSKSRLDAEQLLLWLDRPRAASGNDLILAPIKAKHGDFDPIYYYLQQVEQTKSQFELSRLLYVAVTRAKKNLHLLAALAVENNDIKAPANKSFLQLLWSPFYRQALSTVLPSHDLATLKASEKKPALLRRLKLNNCTAAKISEPIFEKNTVLPFLATETYKLLGTVIHAVLQQISQEDLAIWSQEKLSQQQSYWKNLLLQAGIHPAMLTEHLAKLTATIARTLQDPRGRWILSPHAEHQSEYPLTVIYNNLATHVILDRTFVDAQQTRWIIDYKTTHPLDADINSENFMQHMQALHQEQLEKYAQAMRQLDSRPIRLGIYFPTFSGWHEWSYHPTPITQHLT